MKVLDQSKDPQLCAVNEITALVDSLSPKELQEYASKMNDSQIHVALLHLINGARPNGSARLQAILRGIQNVSGLEAIGKVLNLAQLIEFLDFAAINKDHAWKLFPIFITIPHPIFSQMLLDMPEKRKQQLQLLCTAEPLQHHLLMYSHELTDLFDSLFKNYLKIEDEIVTLDGKNLLPKELTAIQQSIGELREKVNHIRSKIENALSLAWNAGNSDLIEMFSNYRERYERFLFTTVGHPNQQSSTATGLYHTLEKELAAVFDKGKEGSEFEALKDNDPAIEALARLSIWYIEDYWNVGLLPEVTDPKELTLNLIAKGTGRLAHYQNIVKQNLKLLGLKTVKDFKRHHLVSKPILIEYIAAHKHKLKPKTGA